jgi:peptide/nickel transport system substrate-binding protein
MVRAAIALLLFVVISSTAHAEARFALLIGNQSYDPSVGVLKNPHNDVALVGDALAKQGFELLPPVKDGKRSAILGAVRELVRRLNGGGSGAIGFIYYSGHGAAEKDTNINYLIPIDAKEPGTTAFWDESVKLDDILKLLDGARSAAKFVVFDACRNELQLPTKDTSKGLVPVAEQQGMFIAYASAPGRTASDKGAKSGPYAAALAVELSKSGLDHLNLFQNVKEMVLASTAGAQQPWESNGLARRIYLTGPPKPVPVAPDVSEAAREWARIDKSSMTELETFVSRHGSSPEADYARAHIEKLREKVAIAPLPLPVPQELPKAEAPKPAVAAPLPRGVKKGGTLNFAVVAEPPNYDCHGSTTFALIHSIAPHYSLLVKFDGENYPKVIPDLAQSWTVAPDGMTLTFKLKGAVKFHDGSSLTSEDVKASYDRIINPPQGVVSIRKAHYSDLLVQAPDPTTVIFKLKNPMAGVLEALASPFNCIYSAAKLQQNPRYPETEIMGSGPFTFVEHVKGSTWTGKRNEAYFQAGKPYLDGYKIFFVKSWGVAPGILGGQFDAEFRGRNPSEKAQLLEKMKDNLSVFEGTWVNNLMVVFNTTRKPFDDVRVRQALSLAIDRWGGSETLSQISILKYVGGVMRPGYPMALPQTELVKLPGFSKDINASREQAKKLLKEAGEENLKFKLLNRNIAEPYTAGAVYSIDQWRRVGVSAEHEQLETRLYQDRVAAGDFDVAIEFQADFMDDPTAQFSKFLTKKLSPSGYSGHTDTKVDELYEKQRHTMNVAERTKIVNEMERYSLVQAYNVPLLWWQRIVMNNKKIQGWHMTPSHYISQDLAEIWLDR